MRESSVVSPAAGMAGFETTWSTTVSMSAARGKRTMRFRTIVSMIVAGLMLCVFAGSASANHAAIMCDGYGATYSNNEEWTLGLYWINWSLWQSDKHFIARRYNASGQETYYAYIPATSSTQHQTNTPDGLDARRRTTIQRAGYTATTFYMNEWSHDGCNS